MANTRTVTPDVVALATVGGGFMPIQLRTPAARRTAAGGPGAASGGRGGNLTRPPRG